MSKKGTFPRTIEVEATAELSMDEIETSHLIEELERRGEKYNSYPDDILSMANTPKKKITVIQNLLGLKPYSVEKEIIEAIRDLFTVIY